MLHTICQHQCSRPATSHKAMNPFLCIFGLGELFEEEIPFVAHPERAGNAIQPCFRFQLRR